MMVIYIQVEFLKSQTSDIYRVVQIPVKGEHVYLNSDDETLFEVKEVFHCLNASESQFKAIVRVA